MIDRPVRDSSETDPSPAVQPSPVNREVEVRRSPFESSGPPRLNRLRDHLDQLVQQLDFVLGEPLILLRGDLRNVQRRKLTQPRSRMRVR